jgi:hypothetical protein
MAKLILSADAHGYSVRVLVHQQIVDEYVAGNCPRDSQVFLSPNDPDAVSEEELREYAQKTAHEMARRYSADLVEEDADLANSELGPGRFVR